MRVTDFFQNGLDLIILANPITRCVTFDALTPDQQADLRATFPNQEVECYYFLADAGIDLMTPKEMEASNPEVFLDESGENMIIPYSGPGVLPPAIATIEPGSPAAFEVESINRELDKSDDIQSIREYTKLLVRQNKLLQKNIVLLVKSYG